MKVAYASKSAYAEIVEEVEKKASAKIKEVEAKKTIEIVRRGWLKGHSIEVIADFSGLSIEEVKKYIAQFEKEKK